MAGGKFTLPSICGPKTRRTAFYCLIALFAALTVHDVAKLFEEYIDSPRQVDMNVVFNETITMPTITICTHIKQFSAFFAINASLAKTWDADLAEALQGYKTREDFLEREWKHHMTAEAMMVAMALTSLEVEIEARKVPANLHQLPRNPRLHGKNLMINDWLNRIKSLNVTYAEFYQKTGTEMLKKGLRRMRRLSSDESDVFRIRHKITWISQLNFCFQPVFVNDAPIKSQGQFLIFQLQMDLERLAGHDLPCMSVDFHGRPSDYVRHLSGVAAGRDGFADNLCPGQYVEVLAEVKMLYNMLPNDDPGRACEELAEDGRTDYECKLRCRVNFIRSMCKCTPPTLAYLIEEESEMQKFPLCNYTQCTINPKAINLNAEPSCLRECRRDCRQLRYSVSRSNAKKTLALNEKHKAMLSRDITTVSLLWGSFEYVELEQSLKYTSISFIAAVGGALGVYLGLSVLTIIVASVYVANLSYYFVVRSLWVV